MSTSEMFEKSFKYFNDNRAELIVQYKNKIIAVHNDKVLGIYNSKLDAFQNVPKEHHVEMGSFLIKDCSEDPQRHIRVYHSNVHFTKD